MDIFTDCDSSGLFAINVTNSVVVKIFPRKLFTQQHALEEVSGEMSGQL
jgi:hypothetical protein